MEESEVINNSFDLDQDDYKSDILQQSISNDDDELHENLESQNSKMDERFVNPKLLETAASFVENSLIASLENLDKCEDVKFPLRTLKIDCLNENENLNFVPVGNIVWPTVAEFTPIKGEEIITFYIKNCWKYSKHWSFVVLLKEMPKTENIQFCVYEAIWSVPTRQSPIPAATAIVYFIISYYKNKPRTETVNVEFNIESSKIKHKPGQSRFDEQWLQRIIETKMLIIRDLNLDDE